MLHTAPQSIHFEDLRTNGNLPCGKVSHVMDVVRQFASLQHFSVLTQKELTWKPAEKH
jgi:hypothetical protein